MLEDIFISAVGSGIANAADKALSDNKKMPYCQWGAPPNSFQIDPDGFNPYYAQESHPARCTVGSTLLGGAAVVTGLALTLSGNFWAGVPTTLAGTKIITK